MANKITKREVINQMLAVEAIATNEVFKAYLENELALLDKKSASRKSSADSEMNIAVRGILEGILTAEGNTVTELKMRDERLAKPDITSQRITSVLNRMVDDGIARKYKAGKKSLYAKAETAEVVEE